MSIAILAGGTQLRSKRELIEKFINEYLPNIADSDDVPDAFENYWNEERLKALNNMSSEEYPMKEKLQEVIGIIFLRKKTTPR